MNTAYDQATKKTAQPNMAQLTYTANQQDLQMTFEAPTFDFESTLSREGQELDNEISTELDFGQNDKRADESVHASQPTLNLMEIKPDYEWLEFEISYYTKNERGMDGRGITKTGTQVEAGRTIAVDPDIIPFGTKVYIEGIGYRIAEDCGSAIQNNRIDVYVDHADEFPAIGRHTTRVRIIQ
ncbi:MAG: 3D domain-containing protein [Eubacteriales bacterium]|nr:3D domain-containing protein [Eubacteriales bacterium]